VVAVSPRELLGSAAQVIVVDELGPDVVLVVLGLLRASVQVTEQHSRDGDRKRKYFPQAHAAGMFGRGCSRVGRRRGRGGRKSSKLCGRSTQPASSHGGRAPNFSTSQNVLSFFGPATRI